MQDSHRAATYWGMLTHRATGRGSLLMHKPAETQNTQLKEQRSFPGNRLPTKFLTTTTHPPEHGQQFQLLIPELASEGVARAGSSRGRASWLKEEQPWG